MLLLIAVCLPVVVLIERLWIRRVPWRAFIVPALGTGGLVAGWIGLQWLLSGPAVAAENAQVLRDGVAIHLLTLDPANWERAIGVLVRTGWLFWGVGGGGLGLDG